MIEWWDYWHGYEAPYGGQGTATTLPVEQERDIVQELHEAVKDATGYEPPRPPPRKIGFY
jgi:hypothetical protein